MKKNLTVIIIFFLVSPCFAEEQSKWDGYIEFMGKPGTTRSVGQSDLFAPIRQDENDLTFFNIRGQLDNEDNSEYNLGIGHRHLFPEFILGAYGYYDHRFADSGNQFDQLTLGFDVLSHNFDFRINGYLPLTEIQQDSYKNVSTNMEQSQSISMIETIESQIVANSPTVTITQTTTEQTDTRITEVTSTSEIKEKILAGFDGEVGYRIPFSGLFEDTRIYAGGYHFIGNHEFDSVSGPRVRLESRIHDLPFLGNGSRLMLGVESQYDDPRGSQTFGLVQLRIPFDIIKDKKQNFDKLKGLQRRMVDPIVRDIDAVTSSSSRSTSSTSVTDTSETVVVEKEEMVDGLDLDGNKYTDYQVFTDQDAMETYFEGLSDGDKPLVVLGGTDWHFEEQFQSPGKGVTLAFAGKELKLTYTNPFTGTDENTNFTPEGSTPTLTFAEGPGSQNHAAVIVKPGDRLNGWDIDAYTYDQGIGMFEAGTAYITNSTVRNSESIVTSEGRNFIVQGDDVNLHIIDSISSGAVSAGLWATDGSHAFLDNVEIYNNSTGIFAGNLGSVSVKNSSVFQNTALGFLGSSSVKRVEIEDSKFYENGGAGIELYGPKSKHFDLTGVGEVYITDSHIYNNQQNAAAGYAQLSLLGLNKIEVKNTTISIFETTADKPAIEVNHDSRYDDPDSSVYASFDNVTIEALDGQMAVFVRGDATAEFTNSTLSGNCRIGDSTSVDKIMGTLIIDGTSFTDSGGLCP